LITRIETSMINKHSLHMIKMQPTLKRIKILLTIYTNQLLQWQLDLLGFKKVQRIILFLKVRNLNDKYEIIN